MQQLLIERFQNYLLDSGLSTGDPIPKEIELAEMFEVSRSDIREVIQHFAQLGLLKRVKKRGTVIQELNEEALNRSFSFCLQMGGFYFEEMKEVRIIMETAIAPLIVSRITPENLEKLDRNLQEQFAALDDSVRFEELDSQFHALLFSCCQNRLLSLFTNLLPILFQKKYRERLLSRSWREIGYHSHCKLVEVLRNHDLALFKELILQHIMPT
ncbi:MAG: FadR family transcriptional regulator [Lentisphaerae bacterium]|nr:FadR family transcriptional regulator [Lentisphaerota bacterium]